MTSRQLIKNFLSLFLSSVLGQLFTLLAFLKIAAVFGPEGFGKFSFAQVFALYFLFFADFGLQTLGTRAVAQSKGGFAETVWTISSLRIVLAALSFVALLATASLLPHPAEIKSLIEIFGIALIPSAVLLEWVFLGIEQMWYVGAARTLKGLIFWGCVTLFVRTPEHLGLAAFYYVAGIGATAVILLISYAQKFGFTKARVSGNSVRKTFVDALPLAAGSFIGQINYNFGTFALGFFLTNTAVGLFSAAHKIVLFLWAFALVAASNSILPLMARSFRTSTREFTTTAQKLLRLFIMIAIPLGFGGSMLSGRIIGFLYPEQYREAAVVFQCSIWMVVLAIYRTVFENALIVSSTQRRYLQGYAVAGVLTIVGNIVLVPILGLIAPAVTGVACECFLVVYFILPAKFVRARTLATLTVRPLAAAGLMALALMAVPLPLFPAIAFGVAVYATLLLAFRGITVGELLSYARFTKGRA